MKVMKEEKLFAEERNSVSTWAPVLLAAELHADMTGSKTQCSSGKSVLVKPALCLYTVPKILAPRALPLPHRRLSSMY